MGDMVTVGDTVTDGDKEGNSDGFVGAKEMVGVAVGVPIDIVIEL